MKYGSIDTNTEILAKEAPRSMKPGAYILCALTAGLMVSALLMGIFSNKNHSSIKMNNLSEVKPDFMAMQLVGGGSCYQICMQCDACCECDVARCCECGCGEDTCGQCS